MTDLGVAPDYELERLARDLKVEHVKNRDQLKSATHKQALLDNLWNYNFDMERYAMMVVNCANAREEHYRKCIYKTKQEEAKHETWRNIGKKSTTTCPRSNLTNA